MNVLTVGLIGLAATFVAAVLAIFSAHIPGLRYFTGAAQSGPASRPVPYTEAATETDSSFLRGDFPQAGNPTLSIPPQRGSRDE